jgi:hypothetical protein
MMRHSIGHDEVDTTRLEKACIRSARMTAQCSELRALMKATTAASDIDLKQLAPAMLAYEARVERGSGSYF